MLVVVLTQTMVEVVTKMRHSVCSTGGPSSLGPALQEWRSQKTAKFGRLNSNFHVSQYYLQKDNRRLGQGTGLTLLVTVPATGLGGYQVHKVDNLVNEKSLSSRMEGCTKVCVDVTRFCVLCIIMEISSIIVSISQPARIFAAITTTYYWNLRIRNTYYRCRILPLGYRDLRYSSKLFCAVIGMQPLTTRVLNTTSHSQSLNRT